MNIFAYYISGIVIFITILLVVGTLLPILTKRINLKENKTKIYLSIIIVLFMIELVSIALAITGETSEYIIPAPSYVWLIFKISSLVFLWVWTYFYFFIWIKTSDTKKT